MRNGIKIGLALVVMLWMVGESRAQAPAWQWAKSAGEAGYERGNAIAVDSLGNSVVTGSYVNTISLGNIQLVSQGGKDVFIVKYDATGNVVWAKNAGGAGNESGSDISVDASGNCYLTGSYEFNTGIVNFDTIQLNTSTSRSGFLAKLDSNGDFQWVKRGIGQFSEWHKLATDQAGNCFVTGVFGYSLLLDSINLVSSGSNDVFIVSYNSEGEVLKARNIAGGSYEWASDISLDTANNIFVVGGSYDWPLIDFDGITPSGSFTSQDLFFVKLDNSWNIEWANVALEGPSGTFTSTDQLGNSYLTGTFYDSITFGSFTLHSPPFVSNSGFVVKFNHNGSVVWARSFTSSVNMYLRSIITDASSNVYFTGMYYGVLTIGSSNLTSVSNSGDVLIAKLDSSGNSLWAKGSGTYYWNDSGNGIGLDGSGNCYLTGWFGDGPVPQTILFDSIALTSAGLSDLFIAKLGNTPLSTLSPLSTTSFTLSPNPARSQVRLTNLTQASRCTLYNLLGQQVLTQALPVSATEAALSLHGMAPGLYTLQVQSATGVRSEKLIIE